MAFAFDKETIGILVGGVAAVAGIVAAIFAVRSDRATRGGARLDTARWQSEIQPRPRVGFPGAREAPPPTAESSELDITVSNAGGAMADGYVVVRYQGGLYGGRITLPAHSTTHHFKIPKIGKEAGARSIILALARDISGQWWDCGREQLIEGVPDTVAGSTAFMSWLRGALEGRGETAFTGTTKA